MSEKKRPVIFGLTKYEQQLRSWNPEAFDAVKRANMNHLASMGTTIEIAREAWANKCKEEVELVTKHGKIPFMKIKGINGKQN